MNSSGNNVSNSPTDRKTDIRNNGNASAYDKRGTGGGGKMSSGTSYEIDKFNNLNSLQGPRRRGALPPNNFPVID